MPAASPRLQAKRFLRPFCHARRLPISGCYRILLIVSVTGFVSLSMTSMLWRLNKVRNLAAISGSDDKLLTFYSTRNWGTGNHMFAFASTLSIAAAAESVDDKRRKTVSGRDVDRKGKWIICIGRKSPLRLAFEQLSDLPSCEADEVIKLIGGTKYVEIAYAKYDQNVINDLHSSPFNHAVLYKFFQSWKYFVGRESEIRELFRFTPRIQSEAHAALADVIEQHLGCVGCYDKGDVIAVGVHVRRGDMEEDISLRNLGYKTADVEYLIRAMNYMTRKLNHDAATSRDRFELGQKSPTIVFVVVSDDIEWCEENLQSARGNDRHIVFVSTRDSFVDMAALAQCRHSIITVGTFGWWSAWLANGTTVYFGDWPEKGSPLDRATSHSDYFYPHWIPL